VRTKSKNEKVKRQHVNIKSDQQSSYPLKQSKVV